MRGAMKGHHRELVPDLEAQALVQMHGAMILQGHGQGHPLKAGPPVAPERFEQQRPSGAAAVLGKHGEIADETLSGRANTGHQMAARLNVKLDLKKLPVAAHSDLVQTHKALMALWTDSPIQPDVNYVINLVYTSGPLSLVNYNNFSDPEVDKMIESGASIIDPAKRLEHHKGVQQRIQDEAAMGWVVEPYYRVGLSRNLQGFRWYTTQFYLVSQLTFIK